MFVTEEEYDQWPSYMWEDVAREGGTMQTCSTCAHYGCCDGLPNCDGRYWTANEQENEDER